MAKKLFISYRRKDWPFANLLRLELSKHLDADIFMDTAEDHGVSEIRFATQILKEITSSDAFLLIVTEHTFAPDRLKNPKDWVVREVKEAIEHEIPIILAAWDENKVPGSDALPESIQAVSGSQAIRFVPEYFSQATERLAKFIDKNTDVKLKSASTAQSQNTTPRPPIRLGVAGILTFLAGMMIATLVNNGGFGSTPSTPGALSQTKTPATRIALAATELSVEAYGTLYAGQTQTQIATLSNSQIAETNIAPQWTKTPTPLPPGVQFTDEKGVVMVWVPPGTFMMGSTDADKDAESDDEKPQTRITFDKGFWIDRTEVTNKDYKAFIDAKGYQQDQWWPKGALEWKKTRNRPNDYSGFTGDDQPRVGVYGVEAMSYCAWRGGKLPDESEWEYAARGSDGRLYPWGNQAPDASRAVFGLGSNGKTLPVNDGKRLQGASWVGALDMAGNVWEFTASIYGSYPFKPDPNFRDTATSEDRLSLRGGAYYQNTAGALRVANRNGGGYEGSSGGFRCARSS
jgi:formylglycine-generating enzyme required for sulfatase activity